MADTPIIVRSRREAAPKEFSFQPGQMRTDGLSEGLRAYRLEAWQAFQSLLIPTPAEEAWRRTDLRALRPAELRLPEVDAYRAMPQAPADLLRPLTADAHGGQVVLLPGGAQVQLDEDLQRQGVIFTDLVSAEREHPALLEKVLGKVVHPQEGKFAALAGALAQNGVFLYVPRGVQVEQPLHSLVWGPGLGLAYLTQVVVYLEAGASVTYVHEAASPEEGEGQTLHAGTVELFIGEGATLRFVELQSWGQHVWNFSHERAHVERDGNLEWIFGAVGSRLTKNFSELDLTGQGGTGKMSGFYITNHNQHLDHDTQQNHMAPNTTSDLLFKGVLLDESRSVWQGMIYVAPGAVKTDGYQANRNLVLSPNARADSIPGLEILADDVRCTHGATVGKIDPDQVFYLLSRGIPRAQAERLVVEGFFDPIMQRIPFEGVRERFQAAI
ncbi:MAG TPA: Fe-S cluster assembly protein SufD, partial [Anaerolineaceae bacterium]|nr:Fe-S cluster assembly protein SufD [Anaerolineaceae bacterium]